MGNMMEWKYDVDKSKRRSEAADNIEYKEALPARRRRYPNKGDKQLFEFDENGKLVGFSKVTAVKGNKSKDGEWEW